MVYHLFLDKEVQKPGENKKELLKYDTHGSIVIVPTADDNDMDYTCEANHPALPYSMPLRATIKLSVFCEYNFRKSYININKKKLHCISKKKKK